MKKQYVAPQIEIERYDLSASLAFCQVTLGPTLVGHAGCSGGGDNVFGWLTEEGTFFYDTMTTPCTIEVKEGESDLKANFPSTFSS